MMKEKFAFLDEDLNNAEALIDFVDKQLHKSRSVFLNDDIDHDTMGDVVKQLMSLDRNKGAITVYLNTNGGDAYEILTLYDTIRCLKNKVHIHVLGYAFSAGAVIAACCGTGKRMCGKNTTFMIHEISSWAQGKFNELKDNYEETGRLRKVLIKLLVKHTKLSTTELEKKLAHDFYFDAKKAKRWGFVDVIK